MVLFISWKKQVKMLGFISWLVSVSSLYRDTIFLWCGNKYTPNNKYLLELIKRRSKVQEKNVISSGFKFWPMKNIFRKLEANESLIMACLQIYRELLSLATFLKVHSNSEEVSYLSWQNTYPNLKTTCCIKQKFFLWTKIQKRLLLAKYLISVTVLLIISTSVLFWIEFHLWDIFIFKHITF